MSIDFRVDSSTRHTDTQTHKVTDTTDHRIHASAGVADGTVNLLENTWFEEPILLSLLANAESFWPTVLSVEPMVQYVVCLSVCRRL